MHQILFQQSSITVIKTYFFDCWKRAEKDLRSRSPHDASSLLMCTVSQCNIDQESQKNQHAEQYCYLLSIRGARVHNTKSSIVTDPFLAPVFTCASLERAFEVNFNHCYLKKVLLARCPVQSAKKKCKEKSR